MAYAQERESQHNEPILSTDFPRHAQQVLRQRNRAKTENKIAEGLSTSAAGRQETARESFCELNQFAERGDDSSGYIPIKHLCVATDQAMATVLDFKEPVAA